jgi:hypothetical protein
VLALGQRYVSFEKCGRIQLNHQDGTIKILEGGLIEKIGYGESSFSIPRVAQLLNIAIPKTTKKTRKDAKFSEAYAWVLDIKLPRDLLRPKVRPTVAPGVTWRANPRVNQVSRAIQNQFPGLVLSTGSLDPGNQKDNT